MLWLTNDEKATIENNPDPRSGNDSLLNFKLRNYYTYGVGNGFAVYAPSLYSDKERMLIDIDVLFTAVVAHELAHSNDYFAQDRINSFSRSQVIGDVALPTITESLYNKSPLVNQTLLDLGQVLYHGEEASINQKNITAQEYGLLFDSEGAVRPYAYSTQREDMATLFEVSMVKYVHPEVEHAVASMSVPYDFDNKPLRGWFNRLGAADVKQRAEFVAEQILPEVDWSSFFQNLKSETEMNYKISLRENIWGETP